MRGPAPASGEFSRQPEMALFAFLETLGVPLQTFLHPPVATVAESREVKIGVEGAHTKNLFLKDGKGEMALVSASADSALPLNRLHRTIGTQRLSFTDAGLLWEVLGVTPGSVSGFALLNDAPPRVRFVLDKALLAFDTLNFHPLRNDMTTSLRRDDFLSFVMATGHDVLTVDFIKLAALE